jgi:hypothetical protein
MRFEHVEIDGDDENWDIGYVNTMEDVQRYIDKYAREGITFQTDVVVEDSKYSKEHYMVMKRKVKTDIMIRMYDVTTDTWYVQIGDCTYCGIRLYCNEELGDRNCSRVKTNDGRMIDICDDCAKYMKNAGELVQVSPPHNGSIDHSYRFVNPKEKKKCRQAV